MPWKPGVPGTCLLSPRLARSARPMAFCRGLGRLASSRQSGPWSRCGAGCRRGTLEIEFAGTSKGVGTKSDLARLPALSGVLMVQNIKQQRDLFESERSFRLLVEGVADYALYMLDPTGVITSWNIGGQRIKGYSPGEIVGQHFSRFYTETDRANGKPARALRIAREQGRYEEEGWRVRKDGTFFWASVVIDPIYEDGHLVGFAKITRDITERRDTQLKLEQMQKQLAEAQK